MKIPLAPFMAKCCGVVIRFTFNFSTHTAMEVVCRRWLSLESNSIPTNAIVWRILSPNYGGKSATNHAHHGYTTERANIKTYFFFILLHNPLSPPFNSPF